MITNSEPALRPEAVHDPKAAPIVEAFLVSIYNEATAEDAARACVYGYNTNTAGERHAVACTFTAAEVGEVMEREGIASQPIAAADVVMVRALLRQWFHTAGRTREQWEAIELVPHEAAAFEHDTERFPKYANGYMVAIQPRVTITSATNCPRPKLSQFVRMRSDDGLLADAVETIRQNKPDAAGEVLNEVGRRGLQVPVLADTPEA
jgi:hypothetical protein